MNIRVLRRLDLFQGLDDEELTKLSRLGEKVTLPANTVLFEEDSLANDLFIVQTGTISVEIILPGSTERVSIAQVRPNEILGELALIDGNRRSAAARTSTDAVLHRYPRAELLQALEDSSRLGFVVMHNLARIVSRRLRDTNFALRTTLTEQRKLLGALS